MDSSSPSLADIAALQNNDGMGMIWLFAILALAGGGFNFAGRGYQPQYATQDFVQNGFNFNDLQDQNRDIMTAITNGTAQAVAASNQAEYETIAVAKDAQYQLQQGLNQLMMLAQQNQANESSCCCQILRAIDGVNYNNAMSTASINATVTAKAQELKDMFTGNRMADMQNQINSLQLQLALAGVVRYPSGLSYNAGPSPFCNFSGSF